MNPKGLWAGLAAWVAAMGVVAVRLPIDNWDGFEYLVNARLIAGQQAIMAYGYQFHRPPLLPLLVGPLEWSNRACGETLWRPHLLAVGIAALSLVVCYRLLIRVASSSVSAIASAALAVNALMVHYAPFTMADILSMLLGEGALLAWLIAHERKRIGGFAIAGAVAGLAIASKFPMVLVVAAFALFEVLRAVVPGGGRPALRERLKGLLLAGPWVGAVVAALTFAAVWVLAGWLAVPTLTWDLAVSSARTLMLAMDGAYDDPWFEYFGTLWLAFGLPWAVCAAVGLVEAVRQRRNDDLLHLAWVAVFLGLMSFYVTHKEARYVLPAVPSLLFLGAGGAARLWAAVPPRRWLAPVGVVVLLAWPAWNGAKELRRFGDPVYAQPVLADACHFALEQIGPLGRVAVGGGRAWSLFSPDPVTFPHDEYHHFHHLSAAAFEYFARRPLIGANASRDQPIAVFHLPHAWYEGRSPPPGEAPPMKVEILRPDGSTAERVFRVPLH